MSFPLRELYYHLQPLTERSERHIYFHIFSSKFGSAILKVTLTLTLTLLDLWNSGPSEERADTLHHVALTSYGRSSC